MQKSLRMILLGVKWITTITSNKILGISSLDGVSIINALKFEEIKITIGKTKEQAEAFMIHNDKNDVTIMTPSISLLGKKLEFNIKFLSNYI